MVRRFHADAHELNDSFWVPHVRTRPHLSSHSRTHSTESTTMSRSKTFTQPRKGVPHISPRFLRGDVGFHSSHRRAENL